MNACVGKQLDPGRNGPESLGSEGGLRLLFLGSTGAGKTRVVEATAEVLFGDPRAVISLKTGLGAI
jgi:ATP-dependent Clp protease ATP-binding subunit ClpA